MKCRVKVQIREVQLSLDKKNIEARLICLLKSKCKHLSSYYRFILFWQPYLQFQFPYQSVVTHHDTKMLFSTSAQIPRKNVSFSVKHKYYTNCYFILLDRAFIHIELFILVNRAFILVFPLQVQHNSKQQISIRHYWILLD